MFRDSKKSGAGMPTDLLQGWRAEQGGGQQSLYEAHKSKIAQREGRDWRERPFTTTPARNDTLEVTRAKPRVSSSAERETKRGGSTPGLYEPLMASPRLPRGWSATKTKDGETFYVNHIEMTTTWDHPVAAPSHASDEPTSNNGVGEHKNEEGVSSQQPRILGGITSDEPRRTTSGYPSVTATTTSGDMADNRSTKKNSHRRSTSTHARTKDAAPSSNRRRVPDHAVGGGGGGGGGGTSSNNNSTHHRRSTSTSVRTKAAEPSSGGRRVPVEDKLSVGTEGSTLELGDGGSIAGNPTRTGPTPPVGITSSTGTTNVNSNSSSSHINSSSTSVRTKGAAGFSSRRRVLEDWSSISALESSLKLSPEGLIAGKPKHPGRSSIDSNATSTGTTYSNNSNNNISNNSSSSNSAGGSNVRNSSNQGEDTSTSARTKEAVPTSSRRRVEDKPFVVAEEPAAQLPDGGLVSGKPQRTSRHPADSNSTSAATSDTGAANNRSNGSSSSSSSGTANNSNGSSSSGTVNNSNGSGSDSHKKSTSTSVITKKAATTSGRRRVEDLSPITAQESSLKLSPAGLIAGTPKTTSRSPIDSNATSTGATDNSSNNNSSGGGSGGGNNSKNSSHGKSTSTSVRTKKAAPTSGRRPVEDQSFVVAEEPISQLPDGGLVSGKPQRTSHHPADGSSTNSAGPTNNSSNGSSGGSHKKSTSTSVITKEAATSPGHRRVEDRPPIRAQEPSLKLSPAGLIAGKPKTTGRSPIDSNATSTSATDNNINSSSGGGGSNGSKNNNHGKLTSTSVRTKKAAPTSGRRRVEGQSFVVTEEPISKLPDGGVISGKPQHTGRHPADGSITITTTSAGTANSSSNGSSGSSNQNKPTPTSARTKEAAPSTSRHREKDRPSVSTGESTSQRPIGWLNPPKPRLASPSTEVVTTTASTGTTKATDGESTSKSTSNSTSNSTTSRKRPTSSSATARVAAPTSGRRPPEEKPSVGAKDSTSQLPNGGLNPGKSRPTGPSTGPVATAASTGPTKQNDGDSSTNCTSISSTSRKRPTSSSATARVAAPTSGRRPPEEKPSAEAKDSTAQLPNGGTVSGKPGRSGLSLLTVTATGGKGNKGPTIAISNDSSSNNKRRSPATSGTPKGISPSSFNSRESEKRRPAVGAEQSPLQLPDGWSVAFSKSGRRYYVNNIDKTTRWEKPRGPATSEVRKRAARFSGLTGVQSSPSATTSGRDSEGDRRPPPNGADETGKHTRVPPDVVHGETGARLASPPKSLVVITVASRDGVSTALRARSVHNPRTGHSPEGPESSSSDPRGTSNSTGKSRDERTGHLGEGSASASSGVPTASNTSGSKTQGDHTGHAREGLASSSSDTRASSNSSGRKSHRAGHSEEGLASSSSNARTSSNTSDSKARGDHTGRLGEGSVSSSSDARTASNTSDSKARGDHTGRFGKGSASNLSDARTPSHSTGSKPQDDRTGCSRGESASAPPDAGTASNNNRKLRDGGSKHSRRASTSISADARDASNVSGESRGDHDISVEKSSRAIVPPPDSTSRNDPPNASRGGRAAHSGQSAGSPTGQTRGAASCGAMETASSQRQLPELPALDPGIFGSPGETRIPAELEEELEENHPKIAQHELAQQEDPHAVNPPGTFAQSLSAGVNLEPSKLATGIGKGRGKFAKKMATAPDAKPPPKVYAGDAGGGFSIPGRFPAGDLKPELKRPSTSGVKEQMGGTATKMLNGMITSGLDMVCAGDCCELKPKTVEKGGLTSDGELDLSFSDSEPEQESDDSDTECEEDVEVELDLEWDAEDVVEWDADDVETDEEESEEEESEEEESEEGEEDEATVEEQQDGDSEESDEE